MVKAPFIIGIAGGSGSGKTFFLRCFQEHFEAGEICLLSQDDYYFPVAAGMTREENTLYNFDRPETIDRRQFMADIEQLIAGNTVYKKEYTFNNPNAVPKMLEIKPAPILIIEGLFIFHFEEIAQKLDLKIFIEADEPIALSRRLKRDLHERGYDHEDVMYRWHNHVMPAYQQYLLPYRDQSHRHVANNTQVADDIIEVTKVISDELKRNLFGAR